jgi:hypothetical protein
MTMMITPSSLIQPTGFAFASITRPWSQGRKSSWERGNRDEMINRDEMMIVIVYPTIN